MNAKSLKKIISACFGNCLEHFDTALFGSLSPFLAPIIFPGSDAITALILTYAILPLGLIARPLGSLLFGYLGDLYSRETALFISLTGMGIVSCLIGFTPTYSSIGFLAPSLFCLGRILQNFFAAGETMGGGIYVLENLPEKRHDLFSGIYGASSMIGHLLAAFAVYGVSQIGNIDSGWRFLYFCGGCLALLGSILFRREFSSVRKLGHRSISFMNIFEDLWKNRFAVLSLFFASGFAHATYSVALVLPNGLVPLISNITKIQMMHVNMYLVFLDLLSLPFFGWIASFFPRKKFMMGVSLLFAVFAAPLFSLLSGSTIITVVCVRILFVLLGVAFFAPFHAWAQALVPMQSRFMVISFSYALGGQLLGSPAAAISLWTFQKFNDMFFAGLYPSMLAAFAFISIYLTKKVRLHVEEA